MLSLQSHIASGIIPFAALASASPNAAKYIGKSRSPSPIARAIAFAGRIGHVIAAGDKLERSLSERDIYRRSGSAIDLSQMKQISKSHPGPSGFEEPVADLEVEEGYESVKEIRSKLFARLEEDGRKMDERPVMPLPDEEDGVEHNSQEMEDLYSKVVKHGVVNSRIEKVRRKLSYLSTELERCIQGATDNRYSRSYVCASSREGNFG